MKRRAGGRAYTRTSPLHINININTNINTHVMMCLMEEERSYVMERLILDRLSVVVLNSLNSVSVSVSVIYDGA